MITAIEGMMNPELQESIGIVSLNQQFKKYNTPTVTSQHFFLE